MYSSTKIANLSRSAKHKTKQTFTDYISWSSRKLLSLYFNIVIVTISFRLSGNLFHSWLAVSLLEERKKGWRGREGRGNCAVVNFP